MNDQYHTQVDKAVHEHSDWAKRRRKDIPNNKNLFVLACMDERLPVRKVLDLEVGDAHIYRNAGGKVTDDVIRSAALTTNFFGTNEIIVVNHTDCGMMSASNDTIRRGLSEQTGGFDNVSIDPSLPKLNLNEVGMMDWIRMTDDIDEACATQVEYLRESEFIPDSVAITGYVYEVESDTLRKPGDRIAEEISERHI